VKVLLPLLASIAVALVALVVTMLLSGGTSEQPEDSRFVKFAGREPKAPLSPEAQKMKRAIMWCGTALLCATMLLVAVWFLITMWNLVTR
jgi:hypothetical protein